MVQAINLCGEHIGQILTLTLSNGREIVMEDVTMITHKKNGRVIVRWSKQNRQTELRPEYELVVNL